MPITGIRATRGGSAGQNSDMTDTRFLPWADAVTDADAALLARYAADRDAAAFAVLVHRHGPTVFGVCLRNAGHRADAEDAFQAVFLLLAKQAGTLRQPELLGHWLYGVAYRVARKARRAAGRRRTHEAKAVPRPEPRDSDWADVAPVLDDELMRLAEHHRAAVVLCDVQGLSRTDAAARLSIPEGTLSSRLNAARKKLADRLSKRGVTLSIGVLAAHATAAVSDELASRLAKVLTVFHSDGVLSAPLTELISEGVLSMRAKILALVAAFGLGSVGVLAAWPTDDPKPQPEAKAKADPPPKAEVPKAEPPKEDFNRPPREKRAKLVDSIDDFEVVGDLISAIWSEDGKRLMFEGSNRDSRSVSPRATGIAVSRISLPWFFDLFDGGKKWMAREVKGTGVNAVARFVTWDFTDTTKPTKNRLSAVEYDRSADGDPSAVSPDGKTVFTLGKKVNEAVGKIAAANESHFIRALSAETGDPIRTIAKTPDGERYACHEFSPTRDRLYFFTSAATGGVIRAIRTTDGKLEWERKFDKAFPTHGAHDNRHALCGEGKLLSFALFAADRRSSRIRILDADTGKDGIELGEQGSDLNTVYAMSPDRRFLAGRVADAKQRGSVPATSRLVVWEIATGKPLASWVTTGRENLFVTFAPGKPLMVLWQGSSQRPSQNTVDTGTLGFWDLSGLLK